MFGIFPIGLAVVSLVFIPVVAIGRSRAERTVRTRKVIQRAMQLFVWLTRVFDLLKVSIEGEEILMQSSACVLAANHPTLIDALILLSKKPNLVCITKHELWFNPVWRIVLANAEFISQNDSHRIVASCVERVSRGSSILIFPEGHRSEPHRAFPFHQGAAAVALRSGVPIVPIAISFEPPGLLRGQRWYQMWATRYHMRVSVGTPIPVSRRSAGTPEERRERMELTAAIEGIIRKR